MSTLAVRGLDEGSLAGIRSCLAQGAGARWLPEFGTALLLVAGFIAVSGMPLNHDVVWQLWIGRQLYHGADLYTDILEVNPPLWFWLATPLAALSEATGVRNGLVLIGGLVGAMAVSLGLFGMLVREKAPGERAFLYAALIIAFFLIVLSDFGQREHFTLIAVVPYVALAARRMEGLTVRPGLALAVGLFAAAGLALKHYYAAVPVALVALHLLTHRKDWRPWHPEYVALAGAAAAYAAAILLFAPEFLRTIVPMVDLAYHGYEQGLLAQVRQPLVLMAAATACGFLLYGAPRSQLSRASLAAAAAFLVGYFLQQKGWHYHLLPVGGLLLLAIVAEFGAASGRRPVPPSIRRRAGVVTLCTIASLALVWSGLRGPYHNPYRAAGEQALAGLRRGETVMALSANAATLWPMLDERGLVWPSRHFAIWVLPAIAEAEREGRSTSALRRLAAATRAQVSEELACAPPVRIFVDTHRGGYSMDPRFDTLGFFLADTRTAELFASYREGRTYGRLRTFARVEPVRVARPHVCRKLH